MIQLRDAIGYKGENVLNFRHHSLIRRLPVFSKRIIASVALLSVLSTSLALSSASAANAGEPQINGTAAILMDAASGQILYQYKADEPHPPASMAKMMTEYLVIKAVQAGKITWDQEVATTENAAKQIGSRIFLAQGDKHTVRDLYIAMAVGSANDATAQLAEVVGGSEEEFTKLMNDTAKELGMTHSRFINATGLDRADMPAAYQPTSIDGETEMSARDSAILGYHILKETPEFLEYSKMPNFQFREGENQLIDNWDWMLESNLTSKTKKKFAYKGVDGLKTGHTSRAGNNFTGTALRDGTRLIAVVMGVPGGTNDGKRFLETAKLFDYGFNSFEKKTVVEAKKAVPEHETLKVKKGKSKKVNVITATDVSFLVPKGATVEATVKEVKSETLKAPIEQGAKVGTVTYEYKDPATQEMKSATVDLVAAEEVKKGSWWRLFFRGIGNFFGSLFRGIADLF